MHHTPRCEDLEMLRLSFLDRFRGSINKGANSDDTKSNDIGFSLFDVETGDFILH